MTTPSQAQKLIQQGQRAFRRQLADEANASARRLATAYSKVLDQINQQLRDLRAIAGEKGMTTQQLGNEASLVRLREQLKASLDEMRPVLERESRVMQADGIEVGLNTGANALETLGVSFGVPTVQQIQALINYVDSAAFQANIANYGDAHVQAIGDILITGMTNGKGPVTIARQISNYVIDFPLADAVRMTRTVQIWSARQGAHETFRQNADVVDGWIWSCSLDTHTCVSCWAMQGTYHSNDETLNDHHLGRCGPIPVTKSWADLGFGGGSEVTAGILTGEDLFGQLPESQQKQIMGVARWSAWQDGLFNFSDLSTTYNDPVYGTMRKAASLNQLIGDQAAALYKRKAA